MLRASPAIRLLLASLLLLTPPVTAWGLDTDRSQPIHIEADRATLNEKGKQSIYEGNVQLRQGSLKLQGDRMTVLLTDNAVDKIILTGNPATLQQRRDNEDSDQQAKADSIEYNASSERVVLLGNARIWQTGEEEFSSEKIVFNLKNGTVSAGSNNSRDRVHIILQPKDGQ